MLPSIRPSILSQVCKARFCSIAARPVTAASPLQRMASIRFQSTSGQPQQPIRDNSYSFPLYFHLLPEQSSSSSSSSYANHINIPPDTPVSRSSVQHPTYALSFLPTFPKHNRQVIGFVSHNPSSTEPTSDVIKPNKFTENEAFNTVLHTVIQNNLNKDPMIDMVLQQQLEGWTHICDYRNPAPFGRIPLPEDIFGSVQIIDGVIQASTYQRMPTHRIVSINGLFKLSDYLHEKLVHHLENL